MMNRLLIVLLTLMAVNIPMMQAQPVSHERPDRDAAQFKYAPFKIGQWESLSAASGDVKYGDVLWDFEESEFPDWLTIDNDGDGHTWEMINDAAHAHSGTNFAVSESYSTEDGALSPDNWLISPQVSLSGTLSLWARSSWSAYLEVFAVFVCLGDPNNLGNYVRLSADITAPGGWTNYTFDLSEYGGQIGRIVIRHYNVADMDRLFVDDIAILHSQTPRPVITSTDDHDNQRVCITATGEGHVSMFCDDELVAEGDGCAVYYIPYSEYEEEYAFVAYAQAPGKLLSEPASLIIEVPAIAMHEIPAPEITCDLTENSMVITALGDGFVTLYIKYYDNETGEATTETYCGDGCVTAEIPRTDEYYFVSVWATAEQDNAYPGVSQTQFIEVPPLEPVIEFTEAPVIEYVVTDDGVLVTVTGNGWICVYVYGELVAEGVDCVQYFFPTEDTPGGMEYAITATAQEDGKEVSEYAFEVVFVPGRSMTPEIVFWEEDGHYVVQAVGEGEVFLFANGEPVDNPYVIYLTEEEQHFVFMAYAVQWDCMPSYEVYYEVVIAAIPQAELGDADGDGEITINDVTTLIDYILSGGGDGVNLDAADVDQDGIVTINDVTTLIDYILKGTW